MTGLLTAPYSKSLKRRGELCARMCWLERIDSLTILGDEAGPGLVSRDNRRVPEQPTFDELIAEGDAVPLAGWDFSWFDGRATEERPPWGYALGFIRTFRRTARSSAIRSDS